MPVPTRSSRGSRSNELLIATEAQHSLLSYETVLKRHAAHVLPGRRQAAAPSRAAQVGQPPTQGSELVSARCHTQAGIDISNSFTASPIRRNLEKS